MLTKAIYTETQNNILPLVTMSLAHTKPLQAPLREGLVLTTPHALS
uniref:Uncharacterized protein n=1 Tax=Anguilla anguilla TaxID=7936 RepID=A0A0E9UB07_ANGAN